MSVTTSTEPAVWIGCLACYNNGTLTGAWFQATTADEITLGARPEALRRAHRHRADQRSP